MFLCSIVYGLEIKWIELDEINNHFDESIRCFPLPWTPIYRQNLISDAVKFHDQFSSRWKKKKLKNRRGTCLKCRWKRKQKKFCRFVRMKALYVFPCPQLQFTVRTWFHMLLSLTINLDKKKNNKRRGGHAESAGGQTLKLCIMSLN